MLDEEFSKIDWSERKSADLINRIKRSQYAEACFNDVRYFLDEGYVADVALAKAWDYWGR